jgi:hypothetical protein
MATLKGLDPVVKSTFAANETLPIVPVFRKTETVLLRQFATARSGFPSPSTSPIATLMGLPPVVKSNFVKNELLVIAPPPANVTMNDFTEYAVNPVVRFVTVIGWYVAPTGTVTLSEVEVAAVTVAFTAPKYTMLFAAVVLKFVPVIVTVAPMGPEVGEKEEIVGVVLAVGVAPAATLLELSNLALSNAETRK